MLLFEMFGKISCRQRMKIAHGLLFSILAVSLAPTTFYFFFCRFSADNLVKVLKNDKSMKERDVPDLLCSLPQVLLSGLIGVVSWKRPLSLVVSVC